jgi:hypothetical protein
MKLYKVNGRPGRYSVDNVSSDGSYLAQEAFFFKTREAAEARMAGIIKEDNEKAEKHARACRKLHPDFQPILSEAFATIAKARGEA